MRGDAFSLRKTTRGRLPQLPYARMKNAVLGKQYELSLVFIGEHRARKLNQTHRKQSYTPDVLAFPLGNDAGEIFITPVRASARAKHFDMSTRIYIGYLFIHALLHLDGMHHGATMEHEAHTLLRRFRITH